MHVRKIAASAVMTLAFISTAKADRFDGGWNMKAQTTRGHCGVIQVSLGVERGRIFSTSGWFAFFPINVGGRVSSSGSANMKAVAGPRTAFGTGRFGRSKAQGTWRGRGPSGLCSGVWTATRF